MSKEDMANFMEDVQRVARALHKVTGAVKINYEIHGNSMPHLHVHLFPRYIDDDFPSAPITGSEIKGDKLDRKNIIKLGYW